MFRGLWGGDEHSPSSPSAAAPTGDGPVGVAGQSAFVGLTEAPVEGAEVVDARGRGRGRGRGRARGYTHSEVARAKMRLAKAERRTKEARADTAQVIEALCPPRAAEVSRSIFGGVKFGQSDLVLIEGQAMAFARAGRGREYQAANLNRGVVSHVRAQADGIAAMLKSSPQRRVEHAFSVNVFDDASMWVSKPVPEPTAGAAGTSQAEKNLATWGGRRGKNVHLPVMNLCETVFVRAASTSDGSAPPLLFGTEVHSPAVVLPVANSPTVHHRWSDWSVFTCWHVGARVSSNSDLEAVCAQTPWRTVIVVRDNCIVNDNLVRMQEDALAAARAHPIEGSTAADMALISVSCAAHSAVLAMKPLMESFGDVPKNLVRLGHLLESGRTSSAYIRELTAVVKGSFKYQMCVRLPPESAEWRAKAERILQLSRPAMDLSPEQEQHILFADNGDWDSDEVVHYCVQGSCPLQCNGSARKSERLVCAAVVLAIGGPMCLPLLYRWKGFEKAVAWVWRGVRQHRLLSRAWDNLFPTQKTRRPGRKNSEQT